MKVKLVSRWLKEESLEKERILLGEDDYDLFDLVLSTENIDSVEKKQGIDAETIIIVTKPGAIYTVMYNHEFWKMMTMDAKVLVKEGIPVVTDIINEE